MPYSNISELPANLDVLPDTAKRIWMATFNNVLGRGGSEDSARRIAWTAVKRVWFRDKDGKWRAK